MSDILNMAQIMLTLTNSVNPSTNFSDFSIEAPPAVHEKQYVRPRAIEYGCYSPGHFWISADLQQLQGTASISLNAGGIGNTYSDTIFGHQFEIKKGPPVFSFDPMESADQSKAYLVEQQNDRVTVSDHVSFSQASGFIWTPFKSRLAPELDTSKLGKVQASWHF